MKFSLIKDWQNKGLKCNFCGTTKSVKYSVSMNGAVVCSCNKCVWSDIQELKHSK